MEGKKSLAVVFGCGGGLGGRGSEGELYRRGYLPHLLLLIRGMPGLRAFNILSVFRALQILWYLSGYFEGALLIRAPCTTEGVSGPTAVFLHRASGGTAWQLGFVWSAVWGGGEALLCGFWGIR